LGIAPGVNVIYVDEMVAVREAVILWWPAKQASDVFGMFVNKDSDQTILDNT